MFQKLSLISGLALAVLAGLAFAQQESRKSPHDSTSITLDGKNVTITYGRPYLKGRQAIGHDLVPYGQVWRTGADEATKLTTETDLMIGDLKIPKGEYALFTIPEKNHWTLVVNKVANQWGAFKYDSAQDLGRTPLKVTKLGSPVEQFTMTLKNQSGKSALLTLAWENTQASTTLEALK